MARHVRKNDLVQVITGVYKGKTGKVMSVDLNNDRILVEGVNIRKRHIKPSQQNPQGGRIEKEMPIHISNVMPVSPSTNKPTRVRFETKEDGSKVRVAVKGGDVLSVLKKPKA